MGFQVNKTNRFWSSAIDLSTSHLGDVITKTKKWYN